MRKWFITIALSLCLSSADFAQTPRVDTIADLSAFNLIYLGPTEIDGVNCYHIAGTNDGKSFQFWINNDAFFLPLKMVIVYTEKNGKPQYQVIYTDWKLNIDLPSSVFEFTTPPKARKEKITPRTRAS